MLGRERENLDVWTGTQRDSKMGFGSRHWNEIWKVGLFLVLAALSVFYRRGIVFTDSLNNADAASHFGQIIAASDGLVYGKQ